MEFKNWLQQQEAFSLFGTGPDSSVGEKDRMLAKGEDGESEEGGMPVLQAKLPKWRRREKAKQDYPTKV